MTDITMSFYELGNIAVFAVRRANAENPGDLKAQVKDIRVVMLINWERLITINAGVGIHHTTAYGQRFLTGLRCLPVTVSIADVHKKNTYPRFERGRELFRNGV